MSERQSLEHIVRFKSGHDCIQFDCKLGSAACKPGAGGSHGKHGLEIRFIAKGDAGAVQFLLYTGWMPQFAAPSKIGSLDVREWGSRVQPADLGYHSKAPRYDGHEAIDDACEFCDGQPCYYDGSGLNASDAMYTLVNGGESALWTFLGGYYDCVFNGGEYPALVEYPMPVRGAPTAEPEKP